MSPGGMLTCLAALPPAGGFFTAPLLVLTLFAPPPAAVPAFLFTPVLLTGLFLTGEVLRRGRTIRTGTSRHLEFSSLGGNQSCQ